MTDARVRLIVLSVIAVVLVGACVALWVRGDALPSSLEVITSGVIGIFTGHVYMNGTGGGAGGPGTPPDVVPPEPPKGTP